MAVEWKPSYQLDHDLRTSAEFIAMLVAFAEPIAERAKALAPVGPTHHDGESPGAYRDSIHVEVRTGSTGRKRVAVVADNFKATWIEFGSVHNPAFAVLRKAARQSFGKGKHGLGSGARIGTVRGRRKKK